MDTDIVIKCIAEEALLFEPGTRWGYSFCHDVLAGLCECISGKRFSEYVTENIFIPLGMDKSFYHINADIEAKMAEQYCYDVNESDIVKLQKGGVRKQGVVKNVGKKCRHMIGENYDSGGSGVITTVDDYSKFAAMLANGGTGLNGEKILSSGTVDLMKTNQLSKELLQDIRWPQLKGYGYGLGVRTMIDKVASGSNGSIGEFGWGGAAGATILCDTDINLAVFYAHHMLNPQEEYYQPRLRNIVYSCL